MNEVYYLELKIVEVKKKLDKVDIDKNRYEFNVLCEEKRILLKILKMYDDGIV